jgi:malonyl CoA-acyl carrier protein transacylase
MPAKTAFVFPGQGSQYVGMAKDLYEGDQRARELFDRADSILGFKLSNISFEGPENELKQTKNTQPAIFLHSVILFNLMEKPEFEMAAGHSLGEYSALVASGALSFEDGLKLVRLRGELMQEAGIKQPGTMAAVIGLGCEEVGNICDEASSAGIVQPANFNSPGQIVISGSVAGVHKAMEISKAKGAKMKSGMLWFLFMRMSRQNRFTSPAIFAKCFCDSLPARFAGKKALPVCLPMGQPILSKLVRGRSYRDLLSERTKMLISAALKK